MRKQNQFIKSQQDISYEARVKFPPVLSFNEQMVKKDISTLLLHPQDLAQEVRSYFEQYQDDDKILMVVLLLQRLSEIKKQSFKQITSLTNIKEFDQNLFSQQKQLQDKQVIIQTQEMVRIQTEQKLKGIQISFASKIDQMNVKINQLTKHNQQQDERLMQKELQFQAAFKQQRKEFTETIMLKELQFQDAFKQQKKEFTERMILLEDKLFILSNGTIQKNTNNLQLRNQNRSFKKKMNN